MKNLFAVLFLTLAIAASTFAEAPNDKCKDHLLKAATELVRNDFVTNPVFEINIPAANDFQCFEEPDLESMANAVVIVMSDIIKPTRDFGHVYFFGIFHIHFTNVGVLASAVSFEEYKWQLLEKSDDWKKSWCAIIRSVYPGELKENGCAP